MKKDIEKCRIERKNLKPTEIKRLEPHFLYKNDLETLMTDMGLLWPRLDQKEKIKRMRRWNELFYCADRIKRGEYEYFKHTIDRIEDYKGEYTAVALHSLGKKVMLIEYPPNTEIEKELRRRLESVGIGVNIIEYNV